MKIKIKVIIFSCFILFYYSENIAFPQDLGKNYNQYHQYINRAEISFFLNHNADSCLFYYDQAFRNFKFNFVSDLINAAEIAYFSQKPYNRYIEKAYSYGFKAEYLKDIPLFDSTVIIKYTNFEKTELYKQIRAEYLKTIDTSLLSWTYNLAIEDQLAKRTKHDQYYSFLEEKMPEVEQKIEEYGFPGNRLIGIENPVVFGELGKPTLNFSERVKPYSSVLCDTLKDFYVMIGGDSMLCHVKNAGQVVCFDLEPEMLGNHLLILYLYHYECTYACFKDWMLKEIEKGNLHPREFAMFHDEMVYFKDNIQNHLTYCEDYNTEEDNFQVILKGESDTNFPMSIDPEITNKIRSKYNIVPLKVDAQKREYESQYGFKLFWGFWQCM